MKKIFTSVTLGVLLLSIPTLTYAQSVTGGLENIGSIINTFTKSVVQAVAVLMLSLATTAFFYGIVQYIWGLREGDAGKTKNGNNFMVWGLVALFVMFSVWGIIKYAQNIFGIKDTSITIPDIRFRSDAGAQQGSSAALPSAGTPKNGTNCVSSNGLSGVYVGSVCQPTGDQ